MPTRAIADFDDARRKLGLLRGTLRGALAQGIAEGLFQETRESFEEQRSPEGQAWAPLSLRYGMLKAKLFPGRPILQARRTLLRSLFREAQGTRAIVGSNQVYSGIHQYGGMAGRGRKAKIPARPFLPGQRKAEQEAQRLGEEILQDAIKRQGLD